MPPIDPNIALQVRPIQLDNPLVRYAQVQQIQGAQQQNRLAEMQLAQQEQAQADDAKFRGIAAQYVDDPNGMTRALFGAGLHKQAMDFAQRQQTAKKTGLEVQKLEGDVAKQKTDEGERLLGQASAMMVSMFNDPSDANLTRVLGPAAQKHPETKEMLDHLLSAQDPKTRQLVMAGYAMRHEQGRKAWDMAKAEFKDTGGQLVNVNPLSNAQPIPKSATPGDLLTDERTRSEGTLNRGVTMRGQDISAGNARVMADATKTAAGIKTAFDHADKLRDEFNKGAGEFVKVQDAFGRVLAASGRPDAAGDIALIFGYMKMLDPGSVVREGEFATAQNAASVPDQIRNAYNRALSGERLNPQQRQMFVGQAREQYGAAEKGLKQMEDQYTGLSRQFGVDPAGVVTEYRRKGMGDPPGPARVDSEAQYRALPKGTQYTAPDGSVRVKQ